MDVHEVVAGHGTADSSEIRVAIDARAPAAIRSMVTRELRYRVTTSELEEANLLASELTTNSVRHSGASADADLVFRIELSSTMVRLEVEDPGHDGVIVPRRTTADRPGGFGLNIVHRLSERWGVERVAAGGTCVWAQIALLPPGPP